MKNVQLKVLALCLTISGSLTAMNGKKKLVTVLVKADYGANFEEKIFIDLDTQDKDQYLEQVNTYFGLKAKDIKKGEYFEYSSGLNQSWVEVDGNQFNTLSNERNYSITSLWFSPEKEIDANTLNKAAKYATCSAFARNCFQRSLERFLACNLSGADVYLTLLHIDKAKRVVDSGKDITLKCEELWQDFIEQLDDGINKIINQQLLNRLLVDKNAVVPEHQELVQSTMHAIEAGHMQLLKYALEYGRKASAQRSRIIGSWFEQKMASLKPEELDCVIQNVQLWLAHYQPVENHFVQMRYGTASSWMNKAVLKKTGIGLCLFGLGVAASQLYQRMYSTSPQEELSSAQA